jgi:hypothetical protein
MMNKPKRRSASKERSNGKIPKSKLQASTLQAFGMQKLQVSRSKRLRKRVSAAPASSRRRVQKNELKFRWAETVAAEEWRVYCLAIKALRKEEIPFMLGGGFALATLTGRWRDTKDIDFYIHPRDRDRAAKVLTEAGFKDYFETRPYDRKWIYRTTQSGVIVDIIWAMANQRAQVDNLWFKRASTISVRGETLKVLPLEEFMWCKLYIMQRDHCDWMDVLNLLYAVEGRLDWKHLIERLEEDVPLLKGLLLVYAWLCPWAARELPPGLWRRLGLPPGGGARPDPERDHIRLLDTRHWFAALQPDTQKLEV